MRKLISESRALVKLRRIRDEFRDSIREGYEHKAKSCSTCKTPGACCLDAHFVNVRITRLEAVAIRKVLDDLPESHRTRIFERIKETILRYDLSADGNTFKQTYACPLFESGMGCLVHNEAKPLPCIHHACYEDRDDLPPDSLLEKGERQVYYLDRRVYREPTYLPLPIALLEGNSEGCSRPNQQQSSEGIPI